METTAMTSLLMMIIIAGGLLWSVRIANRKNEALQKKNAKLLPYKWGYWQGYGGYFLAIISLTTVAISIFFPSSEALLFTINSTFFDIPAEESSNFGNLFLGIFLLIISRGYILRRKWPWVLFYVLTALAIVYNIVEIIGATSLQIDPFINIIGNLMYSIALYIYLVKRWHEFGDLS